jgi:hypothetical protein
MTTSCNASTRNRGDVGRVAEREGGGLGSAGTGSGVAGDGERDAVAALDLYLRTP